VFKSSLMGEATSKNNNCKIYYITSKYQEHIGILDMLCTLEETCVTFNMLVHVMKLVPR